MQNTPFSRKKTLNIKGQLLTFNEPKIMAILNVTPDSFFDGGKFQREKEILQRAEQVCKEGAVFIDVGGYSSRPGAEDIPIEEELRRVVPAIGSIAKNFPGLFISVDTFRTDVVKAAVDNGAAIVNDISGSALDPKMPEVIAMLKVPYILMHMKGSPQTMTKFSQYENITREVLEFFYTKVHQLTMLGIKDVIIDPGFGFAKTREQNFELLFHLEKFGMVDRLMVAGLSRKSMIWKTLQIKPEEALNGTTVLNTIALMKGIDILRVHDVAEAAQAIKLFMSLQSAGQ